MSFIEQRIETRGEESEPLTYVQHTKRKEKQTKNSDKKKRKGQET